MNNVIVIIKKELYRFFTDSRMLISVLLLPGLMIYLMYSLMGNVMGNMMTVEEDHIYTVAVANMPASANQLLGGESMLKIEDVNAADAEKYQEKIRNDELDLLIVFPENFDADVALYEAENNSNPAPNIQINYKSTSTASDTAYSLVINLLETYEVSMSNKFDINQDFSGGNLASESDFISNMMSGMMPMLLLMFLFSGTMGIATESIAGEKERGTIATLLVTPVKRGEIAIGKIISLGIIALCSGFSSFIGISLSLPKLFTSLGAGAGLGVYTAIDYILLVLVILCTALLLAALLSIISAFSKTVKEATSLAMPLMIIVMLVGITSMFSSGAQENIAFYFVPLYNTVQALTGIFMHETNLAFSLITICSNLVYTGTAGYLLARMFHSEKIMFSK